MRVAMRDYQREPQKAAEKEIAMAVSSGGAKALMRAVELERHWAAD